jgi:S1-C subfamily serine protease
LAIIGLRFAADSTPRIGVTTGADPTGAIRVVQVEPGSAAATAGVRVGDVLLRVGDIAVADAAFGVKLRAQYAGRPSRSPLPLVVKRGAETITLAGALTYVASPPRLAEDPSASPRAVRLRNGILRGIVDK